MQNLKRGIYLASAVVMVLMLSLVVVSPVATYSNPTSATIEEVPVMIDGITFITSDGHTLVPIHSVFDALGFEIEWEHTAVITRGNDQIRITLGQSSFYTNGVAYEFDAPAQDVDNLTKIPLDSLLESVGYYYTRRLNIITISPLLTRLSIEIEETDYRNDEVDEVVKVEMVSLNITDEMLAQMVESGEIPADVTHLRLAINSISDVSSLAGLTSLTSLDLWGNNVLDVSPLSNLTNLTELILWGNNFKDISSLSSLTKLERLTLGDNLEFNGDLSVLRNFTDLRTLGLGDTWQLRMDFSHLEDLIYLESLQLWGAGNLNDLSVIGGLTNLTNLTIHAARNVRDFTPLGNLTNLTRLDLQGMGIVDVSFIPLASLSDLTELALWNNQIRYIYPLSNLTNLQMLRLGSNPIAINQINELQNALPDLQITSW